MLIVTFILVSFFLVSINQRTTRASDSSWNSRSRKAIEQAVGSRVAAMPSAPDPAKLKREGDELAQLSPEYLPISPG